MANEIIEHKDPMQVFQDKVIEKLRVDIGEMLPDEVLAKLIERAVTEQFFKERINKDGYGRISDHRPSWFVEEVATLATPLIKELVKNYVYENEDEIQRAVDKFLVDQNLLLVAMEAMRSATINQINEAVQQIIQQIKHG